MRSWLVSMVVLSALGCGDDDVGDASDAGDGGSGQDASDELGHVTCEEVSRATSELEPCEPRATDYAPGAVDEWAECISDDGEYHPIDPGIGTIARVEAFEAIAELLWQGDREPTRDDFLGARMLYQEDEGLDSRVVRRYDAHVEVPEGTDCAADGVPDMFPEYCVGPAILQPLILGAFNAGIAGEAPREQAARIEAALLYFLYVSTYKESLTCTDVAKDCDSSYAYYTGGEPAPGGIGLARYVADALPEAHEAAWNGLLAVRCWRDLDQAVPAEDLELRDLARAQYDAAVQRGLFAVLDSRLIELGSSGCDEAHRPDMVFVTTLAGLLDGVLRARLADSADDLQEALDGRDGEVDIGVASSAVGDALLCF